MNRRTPLDHVAVYRAVVADGKRGAAGRVAVLFGVSRQRVCQIVQEHEQRHPVVFAPRVRPGVSQRVTGDDSEPCRTAAAAFDAAELQYIPPPGAYPRPIPQDVLRQSAPFLETLIMSPLPEVQAQARPEVQAFTFSTPLPTLQTQTQTQGRRRLRPAESWLILCACMTAITVLVGTQVLSLGAVMLVVSLLMWHTRI